MTMHRRPLVVALIATALVLTSALGPAPHAHAETTTLNGVSFTRGQSGCTGPLVGVYGASALKAFILQAAQDYCSAQRADGTPSTVAADVEYAPGGDSCPGDTYAASGSDGNEVGVSTVFPLSCANDGQPDVDPAQINDTRIGVNVVDEIAACPGATEPNGGAVNPAGATPCGAFATDPASANAASCSPADLSIAQAQLLYNQVIGNEQAVGGCNHSNAVQNRVNGSGTRITFCFNVYGAGTDNCQNEGSAQALAGTTGAEVNDVCGPSAADTPYAQGYVSRAAVVADPRSPSNTPPLALQGCGVVTLGGASGYNGSCDPVDPSTFTPQNSQPNPGSGEITCDDDLDVAAGRYSIWGYVHLVTNANAGGNNQSAQAFVTYAQNDEQALLQQSGFLLPCQMNVRRTADGGPYTTTTATC